MEILKQTDKKIVYKLPDFSVIDSNFVRALNWPEGINVQMFLFDKPITGEHDVLAKIMSNRLVGLGYTYLRPADSTLDVKLPDGLESVNLSLDALKHLYFDTQVEFYKRWEAELGSGYVKETKMVVEKLLPSAKSVALSENGRPVALLTTVNWKDCLDQPSDWVTWVWIERALGKDVRELVRKYFLKWIEDNSDVKVQCFVNAFNVPSQKFFRKMGFSPEWFHVVRNK